MYKPIFLLVMLCMLGGANTYAKGKRKKYHRPYTIEDTLQIPENIDDCVSQIDSLISPELKSKCLLMREDEFELVSHTGLHEWLERMWYLKYRSRLNYYFSTRGIWHTEDMCSIALTCYYRFLHHQLYELDKQIAGYKDHWHKTYLMPEAPEPVAIPVYNPPAHKPAATKKPGATKSKVTKPAVRQH